MDHKSNLLQQFLDSLPEDIPKPEIFLVEKDGEFGCYWKDSRFYTEVSFFDDGEYNYLILDKETNFSEADYFIEEGNGFEMPNALNDFILKFLYWGNKDGI